MRHAAMLMLMVTGCVAEVDLDDPGTATTQSDLICGSFCDPADPMDVAAARDLVGLYIGSTFPNSTIVDPPTCANLGSDQAPNFECIQQVLIAQNPCGPVAVSCFRHRCNYKLLNNCH